MKKFGLAVIFILLVFQSHSFGVSEAAVLFLTYFPDARATGMGNAFVAVADDAHAAF
ncbi:hypothetical protein JW935_06795 [candidate division KSB1 bacterium]|nr:hypothetical protein [candidate division KSB1 bacterium]